MDGEVGDGREGAGNTADGVWVEITGRLCLAGLLGGWVGGWMDGCAELQDGGAVRPGGAGRAGSEILIMDVWAGVLPCLPGVGKRAMRCWV